MRRLHSVTAFKPVRISFSLPWLTAASVVSLSLSLSLVVLLSILVVLFSIGVQARVALGQDSVAPSTTQASGASARLLKRVKSKRGVCLLLTDDVKLPVEFAQASKLLIYVRHNDREVTQQMKALASKNGLDIDRLVIEHGETSTLPFATNVVDAVVVENVTDKEVPQLKLAEVQRVLRPHGQAIIRAQHQASSQFKDVTQSLEHVAQWAKESGVVGFQTAVDNDATWFEFSKPEPAGIDEWTHWEKGPDNNPVSEDTVIRAPYMTQFLAKPFYIGMPAVTTAAGGRTFLAIGHISHHPREWNMLNKLIARNGYNGTVLWERDLPEGYLVHRSAFVASQDRFFMIDGKECLVLDPESGDEKERISIPGVDGFINWMVIHENVMYVMSGKTHAKVKTILGDRTFGGWSWEDLSEGYYGKSGDYKAEDIPWGFGDTVAAFDLESRKTLWVQRDVKLIDSRSLSMVNNRLFYLCPQQYMKCVDAKTGEIVWTNRDKEVVDLISEPGKNLVSTPGFKTQCIVVATPRALIIQGQTRQNVVAVSTADGYHLWTKKKFTNNPNAIYLDGDVILGVGERGSHVVIDPVSGEEKEDLGFMKRACTRLTATGDSLFCRGEGVLRYDRELGKVLVDGAQRPACNDGAMPAHGLLYMGPWQCDCNLSLIGLVAKCSAGDFQFGQEASGTERIWQSTNFGQVSTLEPTAQDWPTFRSNLDRSSSSNARIAPGNRKLAWVHAEKEEFKITSTVSAGDLAFFSSQDGKVRAVDRLSGETKWEFATGGPIQYPPSIDESRAYFGSADGYAYCVEASSGRLLWRFRAAPVERNIMVYGFLQSTWPVNSGVLVKDGVAYFAAGIIDQDGTHVYAVNSKTGELVWQNNTSGHLNPDLKKGVSVQGNLTILKGQLLLAGGNQVSPGVFDLKTGECKSQARAQGHPQANNGSFVGAYQGESVLVGGRIMHAAPENVSTKGNFQLFTQKGAYQMNGGGIAPAWNADTVAMVNLKHGKLSCCDAGKIAERIEKGYGDERPTAAAQRRWYNMAVSLERYDGIRWQSDMNEANKFEAVSLAVCPNAIVSVVRYQDRIRSQPTWRLVAFNDKNGAPIFQQLLRGEPLPGGLSVDRDGQILVTMLDGRILCYGAAN